MIRDEGVVEADFLGTNCVLHERVRPALLATEGVAEFRHGRPPRTVMNCVKRSVCCAPSWSEMESVIFVGVRTELIRLRSPESTGAGIRIHERLFVAVLWSTIPRWLLSADGLRCRLGSNDLVSTIVIDAIVPADRIVTYHRTAQECSADGGRTS